MGITFSQLTIDMYDRVISLWKQCEGIGLSSADARENIEAYLTRNPGMSFIASVGEKIVGAVLCGHDGRRGYIHHLGVDPNYRRSGIGRQLVEKCVSALKAAGIQKCHLLIFQDNFDGICFWKRTGWTHRSDIRVISKFIESGD